MGSSTKLQTSLYLTKICLGAGLLGLPFALEQSGLVLGVTAIVVACLMNSAACAMLVESKAMMDVLQPRHETAQAVEPFARIAEFTIGRLGVNAVHISIVLTLLGAVAVYVIAITDITQALLPSVSRSIIPIAIVLILLPFTFLKDLSFLSFASTGGTISYVISFVIIFAQGYMTYGFEMPTSFLWPQSIMSVLVAFGVLSFSLGVPVLTFAIQDSMEKPESFGSVMDGVMIVIALLYSVIAALGVGFYSRGGDLYHHVQPNILANLSHTSGWTRMAQLAVLVTLLLTAPLSLAPALNLIEQRLRAAVEREDVVTEMHGLRGDTRSNYGTVEDELYNESSEDDSDRLLRHGRHLLVRPSMPNSEVRAKPTLSQRALLFLFNHSIFIRPICLFITVVIAFAVPCFQLVMSAIGLLTLTLLCNVGPPLFWLRLSAMLDHVQRSLLPFHTGRSRQLYCQTFLGIGALLTLSGAVVISRAQCA